MKTASTPSLEIQVAFNITVYFGFEIMSKPLLRKSEARPRKARLLFYDEIRESTVGNAKTSMLTLMPSSCMAEVGLETAEVECTFNV